MKELTETEVRAVVEVIRKISENEEDGDHISTLLGGFEKINKEYESLVWPEGNEIQREEVEVAIDALERMKPSKEEKKEYLELYQRRHPDRYYGWILDFVITEYKYMNGCLPNPEGGAVDE